MMLDKLGEIETTAIEELVEIKAEQELLESRLEAMAEKEGSVTDEVFDRVRADYGARLESLDETARPLKDQARREYARLRDLHQQCEDGLRAARLDTEELQFRHELGEFEEEDFTQQLEASKEREEERGKELAEAERLTERFVEAFRSREELEEPIAEPVEEPEPPVEEPAAVDAGPELAAVSQPEVAANHTAAIPTQGYGDEAPEPIGEPPEVLETESTPPPPPPAPDSGWDEKTVARGGARLEVLTEDGSGQEYALGVAATTIGRSPDCTIHVPSDSASRNHAEVVLDSRGYVLRDLGSNNGTFVNEQQVTETELNDGDVVRIGLTNLVFRAG